MDLRENQIAEVESWLSAQQLGFEPLITELLDHMCSDLESRMVMGEDFETAFATIKGLTGGGKLKKLEKETIDNLNHTIQTMKKTMMIGGMVAASGLIFGTFFKVMHWPGANILMLLGSLVLVAAFMPTFFLHLYHSQDVKQNKLMFFLGFLAPFLLSIAMLFKMMHWPGANLMSMGGLITLVLGFLPLYFLSSIRTGRNRETSLALVLVLLIAVPILFNLINPRQSRVLNETISGFAMRDLMMADVISRKNTGNYALLNTMQIGNDRVQLMGAVNQFSLETDALCRHLEDLRKHVYDNVSPGSKEIDLNRVDILMTSGPSEDLMVRSGEAYRIWDKIKNLQALARNLTEDQHSSAFMDKLLDTDKKTWAIDQFTNRPVVHVMATLAQLQVAVRALESETITFLLVKNTKPTQEPNI